MIRMITKELKTYQPHRCINETLGFVPHFTQSGLVEIAQFIKENSIPDNFKFYAQSTANKVLLIINDDDYYTERDDYKYWQIVRR